MAAIEEMGQSNRRKSGVKTRKKHGLKTDMTPMVDLGFLLIAFFIYTAQMSEPRSINLNMPADGPPSTPAQSNALTILLADNNQICYYEGKWSPSSVKTTNFSMKDGLGNIIRSKKKILQSQPVDKENENGLMLLIKPGRFSNYQNLVDVLDEVLINDVKKYAIVKPDIEEAAFISEMEQQKSLFNQ